MSALLDKLTDLYGVNEPIIEKTASINMPSFVGLHNALDQLVKDRKLARFSDGIYYIPVITPFGPSTPGINQVIERVYISDKKDIWGYYSGFTLENMIGLIDQVPAVTEIVTNREASPCREVRLAGQSLRLRRPTVKVTPRNASSLQFLDLLERLDLSRFSSRKMTTLKQYIQTQNVQKNVVDEMLPFFSQKVAEKLTLLWSRR